MILILRKKGWVLNPNDKVVNGIFKLIERNDGNCPCHNTSYNTKCPCSNYRENDICCCKLYIKESMSEVQGIEGILMIAELSLGLHIYTGGDLVIQA